MFIKIYFNNKPLFLCDQITEEIAAFAHHDDTVFIDEFSAPAVNSMIHEMRLEKVHAGIFQHEILEKLQHAFWKKFVVIQAGGGLVENEKAEMLLLFRRGKWDLPKGKLDAGETLEACALREVKEETGLFDVEMKEFLLTTYHTYIENGKQILKESYWYRMEANSMDTFLPQTAEDIEEVQWVEKDGLPKVLQNTYPSVIDVLHFAKSF